MTIDEFENKLINGIHVSRYVVSWVKAGGNLLGSRRKSKFIDWLKTLKINGRTLTEEEIDFIWNFASSGKMELESKASKFLKEIGA